MTAHPASSKIQPSLNLRPYARGDIPSMVDILAKWIPTLPNYRDQKVEPSRLAGILEHNITNEGQVFCRVLCDSHDNVVGGIMAFCAPCWHNWGVWSSDIFLFITPEWRTMYNANNLIQSYVAWAKVRGAWPIQATVTSGDGDPQLMRRLLEFNGFVKIGEVFKWIGHDTQQKKNS